jgi:hypothetical protein
VINQCSDLHILKYVYPATLHFTPRDLGRASSTAETLRPSAPGPRHGAHDHANDRFQPGNTCFHSNVARVGFGYTTTRQTLGSTSVEPLPGTLRSLNALIEELEPNRSQLLDPDAPAVRVLGVSEPWACQVSDGERMPDGSLPRRLAKPFRADASTGEAFFTAAGRGAVLAGVFPSPRPEGDQR